MAIISLENEASAMKMNAPPPNVSADEHAKAWRESGYQVNDLNNCFYCENPGHGSAQCKYLNPAVRNSDWCPDPKLWVYKEYEKNGKQSRQRRRPRRSKKGDTDDRTQVIVTEQSEIVANNAQAASFPVSTTPFGMFSNSGQAASFTLPIRPFGTVNNHAQAPSFPVSATPFETVGNNAQAASFPVLATPFEIANNIAHAALFAASIPPSVFDENHSQAPSFPVSATPFETVGNNAQDVSFPISATPSGIVDNHDQAALFPDSASPFDFAGNTAQAASFAFSNPAPVIVGNHAQHASFSTSRSSGFTNAVQNLDFVPLPFDNFASSNIPRHRWAITMGYYRHIANNKDCFVDYHEFTSEEAPYRFRDLNGTVRTAIGFGRVRINVMLGIGLHGEIFLNAVYCPGLPFNLMSLDMAQQETGLHYNLPTYSLHDMSTNQLVAHTFEQSYMLFLRTILE